MDKFPRDDWLRLGKALERRRGQLGYGFRQRRQFAEQFAEGSGLSPKTLSRLEHAERDAYPDDTLALAERIYRWEPGSIESVLRGGEPVPLPGSPGADDPPRFADPALERIWRMPGLSDEEKLGMIALAEGMRAAKARDSARERGA